ncbi:hypothetical protein GGI04_002540 [Coemansia thaxteri]|nr:hypothetical protein GGI04_002540 [Coemansia thaxteri]
MDGGSTTARPSSSSSSSSRAYHPGMAHVSDDSTFIINPAGSGLGGGLSMAQQRLPVSASEFNHMFSPLSLERMFQRNPSATDSGDVHDAASIMGMLWHNSGGLAEDDAAGNTLKQLLINGSNPTEADAMSPLQTMASLGGATNDLTAYSDVRLAARGGERRLPPIPSSPHLRSASRLSVASSGVNARRGQGGVLHAEQHYTHSLRIHSGTPPAPMPEGGEFVGLAPRQHPDQSLRHEVLDKVARRSQPATPLDMHIPLPSAGHRPHYLPAHTADDVTMLPGDSRSRQLQWGNAHEDQGFVGSASQGPPSYLPQGSPRLGHQRNVGAVHRPTSSSKFGSVRRADYSGIPQPRKTSDGSSAHLLTPNDFVAPLPERVGNMVLDKDIGEWVPISAQTHQLRTGSPPIHTSSPIDISADVRAASRGPPASNRSSMSLHASPFPQPLPMAARRSNHHSSYGMGLISPVENQRKIVHEMSERKATSLDLPPHSRPIEDEALGSIVQRLMTPATSPDACSALDLSGSGIRNLAGLAQITSRLEAICLTGNKLQGLDGLPPGLVSLRAPSNWICFSPADKNRFFFARELPHLEEIDLSSNEISDIGVFSGLRHLRVLEVSRNRIGSLRALRGCRRLAHLGLRDNIVTDFDLESAEVPSLATLDMFNNRLRVVPANIAGFSHLAKVNLVKNDLETVVLHGPPAESLRELRLSENPLLVRRTNGVVVMSQWRYKFPGLKTLYLDICNIRQLVYSTGSSSREGHSLSAAPLPWSSVLNLSLRGNALQPSLDIDFACLSHLKNLYTPDTQLVLPRTMPPLNQLLQLVLCNAGLTHLPVNLGAALPQLRLLDISNNADLFDLAPVLQLASSLEVFKCRAVGFGSLVGALNGSLTPATSAAGKWSPEDAGVSPDLNGAALALQSAGEECVALRWLARLRRLRRLDFRFNRCTIELYAPPPVPAALSASGSTLDSVMSPQMPSTSVMGGEPALASNSVLSGGHTMKSMLIPEYKIVMLGTGGVGKSMLTTRFVNGGFDDEYDPTIEDSYRKQCQIDGDLCVLDILDTAGQEEYAALRDYHIRSGNGFIVVYSVTSKSSLLEAEKIAEHVRRVKDSEKVAIVLVGNKCDLVEARTITTLEGEKVARKIRSGFYETSAKNRVNVDDMFIQGVRRIKYFGKQARTSGTGSSASQESNGSGAAAQLSKRETMKQDAAKPRATNPGTKSWMPAKKTTAKDNTLDIIDSYYAMADEDRAPPSPTFKRRHTAAASQPVSKRRNTRAFSQMPTKRRSVRGSANPSKRMTSVSPTPQARPENERPVIRLVGYGTDIEQLKKTANVNKALPVPKNRKQRLNNACPIL